MAHAPQVAAPEPVDDKAIRKAERRAGREGIPFWRRADRREARSQADSRADRRAAETRQQRADERRVEQTALDTAWAALLANQPTAVLASLEAAFADNDAPAAAVGSEGDTVSIVMRMLDRDEIVPEVQADTTPTGRPTVKRLTKTTRNHLHAGAVFSHALATAKEAFAVAPGLKTVLLLTVVDTSGGLRPVYAAAYTRTEFARTDWTNDNAAEIAGSLGGLLNQKGRTDELGCLELGDELELLDVAKRIADDLSLPLDAMTFRRPRA